MAETCEFRRFDPEGNVTYQCAQTGVTLRFFGHHMPMMNLCDDHYFWMPDMKFWRPDQGSLLST
jgi:hypothetical protein